MRRPLGYVREVHELPRLLIGVGGRGAPVHGLRIDLREGGAGWAGLSSVRSFVRSFVRNAGKGAKRARK